MLTQEQLEILHKSLTNVRDELNKFIQEAAECVKPVELDEPIGRVSRGDALQQQQMALANQRNAEERLKRIELALKRHESEDEFGLCCECGEYISFKRLQALPESTLCIECKS